MRVVNDSLISGDIPVSYNYFSGLNLLLRARGAPKGESHQDIKQPCVIHWLGGKSVKYLLDSLPGKWTVNDQGGSLSAIVIYKALCFNVVLGRMNGAPNETRTHSCRFASLAC